MSKRKTRMINDDDTVVDDVSLWNKYAGRTLRIVVVLGVVAVAVVIATVRVRAPMIVPMRNIRKNIVANKINESNIARARARSRSRSRRVVVIRIPPRMRNDEEF